MKLTSLERLVVVILLGSAPTALAFTSSPRATSSVSGMSMVGGRGWDNGDYLSGLSGDDEEREKVQEDYNDFSERRKAFMERQQEIMNTPQGRAFMEQRQQQQQEMVGMRNDFSDDPMMSPTMEDDDLFNVEPGSGGGSRMAQMIAQAKRKQAMQSQMGPTGMNQRLGTPLVEEDSDEEVGNDN